MTLLIFFIGRQKQRADHHFQSSMQNFPILISYRYKIPMGTRVATRKLAGWVPTSSTLKTCTEICKTLTFPSKHPSPSMTRLLY